MPVTAAGPFCQLDPQFQPAPDCEFYQRIAWRVGDIDPRALLPVRGLSRLRLGEPK